MNISANQVPKVDLELQLSVTISSMTNWVGCLRQKMSRCDMGERGQKFSVTNFLNSPLLLHALVLVVGFF